MPARLDPVPADQIAFIEQWIDDGCPEAEPPPTWRPTSAEPAASRYDDVWFQTPRLGWAVNSNGQILRTTDGGDLGGAVPRRDTVPTLHQLRLGNAGLDGHAGTGSQLFETQDGGGSWELVSDLPELAPARVCGLSVVNESVVYASG